MTCKTTTKCDILNASHCVVRSKATDVRTAGVQRLKSVCMSAGQFVIQILGLLAQFLCLSDTAVLLGYRWKLHQTQSSCCTDRFGCQRQHVRASPCDHEPSDRTRATACKACHMWTHSTRINFTAEGGLLATLVRCQLIVDRWLGLDSTLFGNVSSLRLSTEDRCTQSLQDALSLMQYQICAHIGKVSENS